MDKLIERGKQMGLEGPELLKFVTEQQKIEREDRAAEREAEKLKAEVTAEKLRIEAEQEKRKADAEQEMRKVETEKERRKLELEAEQDKRQAEMEIEAERIRTDAELQKEKMRIEEEKTKRDEAAAAGKLKLELETERLKFKIVKQNNSSEHEKTLQGSAKLPQLPIFDDGKDTIDAYLERFERFAKTHKWEPASWGTILSALLTGTAPETYTRLPIDDAENYDRVKTALLKQYNLTQEGFRAKFRDSRPRLDESPSQFATRISGYLDRWMETAEVKTLKALRDLIIREQFITTCPKDLAVHLREHEYTSIGDLCNQADRFLEAHSQLFSQNNSKTIGNDRLLSKDVDFRQRRECYNCGRVGHLRAECRMEGGGCEQKCDKCKFYGHLADVCRNTKIVAGGMHASTSVTTDKVHNKDEADQWVYAGLRTVKGKIGNQIVNTLRNSGCNSICVNKKFIPEDQMTGKQQICTLLDGSEKMLDTAIVDIDTPYFSKHGVEVVCLQDPTFDLVIGDVEGAACKCNPQPGWTPKPLPVIAAVTTRAQALADKKPINPLKVYSNSDKGIDVTPAILRQLQEEDDTLNRIKNKQKKHNDKDVTGVSYECREGIWFRPLRRKVMALAHECLMGGHLGVKKTKDKVQASFYWPGINGDIARFCQSCDVCQRTIPKGKVPREYLGDMPIIDNSFKRVAVDLVGPIFPATDRKNQYILTMVDFATRYPEAVALKDITTEAVAEALIDMFSRLGIPEEILSDQGSQFTSSMMKEISRLLSVKQLVTTPYHPIANGLCEKFNGTLKQILKKLCQENPKDWDRYLNAALFAYREAPQESTGYAPFELLYGRTVRGPLQILKQL